MSQTNKIAILTDSPSNIREDVSRGIFVVPIYVNIGDLTKRDLTEISPAELFNIIDGSVTPTTSAPSAEDVCEKIAKIKELGYHQILCMTLSSALSAVITSMTLALEKSNLEYRIVDTLSVTMGEGLLVYHAADLIAEGKSLNEVADAVTARISKSGIFALVSDLKYLIRGGRLKPLKGMLGTMLKINPILGITDKGRIEPFESVRGTNKALRTVRELIEKRLNGSKKYSLSLVYAKEPSDIDALREIMKDLIEKAAYYEEVAITAALGAQAGPSVQVACCLNLE